MWWNADAADLRAPVCAHRMCGDIIENDVAGNQGTCFDVLAKAAGVDRPWSGTPRVIRSDGNAATILRFC